jgi:uncharacterized protein
VNTDKEQFLSSVFICVSNSRRVGAGEWVGILCGRFGGREVSFSDGSDMASLNRRELLLKSGVLAAGVALSPLLTSAVRGQDSSRKKVLFFTKSAGFQHSVITRKEDDPTKLAWAEQILSDFGDKNGFDVTVSKDGTIFTQENLKSFDVFAFYTTGDLTTPSDKYGTKKDENGKSVPDKDKLIHTEAAMPPGAKEAFLDAIKGGKGFVGFHCASDTFHSPAYKQHGGNLMRDVNAAGEDEFDPYIKMLGGEFVIHGAQQDSTLIAVDPKFPGAKAVDGARFKEEWYSLKNFSHDLHVILAQETKGMTGPMYQRGTYPETWARMHGKGRVFYTSMGHREEVWQKPEFLDLVLAALNWTSGKIDADVAANIEQVTPDAEVKKA